MDCIHCDNRHLVTEVRLAGQQDHLGHQCRVLDRAGDHAADGVDHQLRRLDGCAGGGAINRLQHLAEKQLLCGLEAPERIAVPLGEECQVLRRAGAVQDDRC